MSFFGAHLQQKTAKIYVLWFPYPPILLPACINC